jgi:hypothetical protein
MTVTKQQAMTCRMFYHKTAINRDGTAVRVRASGQCKTWKTRPDEFRLPVKYGLRHSMYITNTNAHEWTVVESYPDRITRRVLATKYQPQARSQITPTARVQLPAGSVVKVPANEIS